MMEQRICQVNVLVFKMVSPLAVYTHCSGHCLNLVISHSCTLPSIRNVLDQMTSVCLFFLNSQKRNELLIEIVTKNVHQDNRRKALIDQIGTKAQCIPTLLSELCFYCTVF